MGQYKENGSLALQPSNQSKTFSPKQRIAIDYIALNPRATKKEIASHVGVAPTTVYDWQREPFFVDAVYETYMTAFGFQLPAVLEAMIREALTGNVQAGRLVLEHSGKLVKNVHVQVDSPFEKFLKAETEVEFDDVEVIEAEYDLDKLPERDKSNDEPNKRIKKEKHKLNLSVAQQKKKSKQLKARRDNYKLIKRANKVGLKLLPPGRWSKGKRQAWLKKLEKLEATSSSVSSSS
tara:strand:+ start:223 stop:927 length:705 start_codon:yes stop_codon:yes gene_type:complete